MNEITIHPRVLERHPQLTEDDIRVAWANSYYEAVRPDSPNYPEFLWIGTDQNGREIEMVGVPTENGWLIYHANTPLSKRTHDEVHRARRR